MHRTQPVGRKKSTPAKRVIPANGVTRTAVACAGVTTIYKRKHSPSAAVAASKDPAFQVPNHKHQISNKFQNSKIKSQTIPAQFGIWVLEFIWNL
jgi:hypothetical protein